MKALKIGGGIVAVLIVGVIVFLLTFDVNQYRGVIQEQAKAATGREVSIGEISLALSLSPAIVVHDVSVGNAPWGSRPEMVKAERIAAYTQLIPLIFGTVNIADLEIIGGDIVLETNSEGKGNWEFDVESDPNAEPVPLNVNGVSAQNLKFTYRDAVNKMSADIAAEDEEVEIDGALIDMIVPSVEVEGAVIAFVQGAMKADAKIGSLELNAEGPILDMAITQVEASDTVANYQDGAMKAEANIGNLALNSSGPITEYNISNIAVSNTTATYTSGGTPMQVAIETAALNDDGYLDLKASLDGEEVTASGEFASIAQLMARNEAFPVKLALQGFGINAETDLQVSLAEDRPSANGSVSVAEVILPQGEEGESAESSGSPDGKVIPDLPIPWDTLAVANADVAVSVGKVVLANGLEITNVAVPIKLSNSTLSADPISMAIADGTVRVGLGMNAGNKSVSLKADIDGFSAENVAKAMKESDLITQGELDFALNVSGRGDTVRQVMASLNGSMICGMAQSRIRSDALNVIGADVIMQVASAINPMGNKDPYTVAQCAVANFQISDGVARTDRGIALVTDKMNVTSSGNINFNTERLDLNVRPKAKSGIGLGLGEIAQAVKVSGTLAEPGVGIDAAGAAKAVGTIGAAIATGGISALLQGAKNRVDAETDGDPCQIARTWHQG